MRCLFLFIGFSGTESSKSVTVLAFPRSEEVLAEKIGLHGAQAMVTLEKINLNWQIRHGRILSPNGPWTARCVTRKSRSHDDRIHRHASSQP